MQKNQQNNEAQPPVEIDASALSTEALQGILEAFVLREGTDYGVNELSLEKKVENLKKKWDRKDVILVFDPNTESVTFLTKKEWAQLVPP
jgi:uncharacterized protein YheU (UPF0270 family)